MDVRDRNEALLRGVVEAPGVLPSLERLRAMPHVFRFEFGLDELPEEPGVLLIRGARQYGKSTWLESSLRSTVENFGPGTALYLNGDAIEGSAELLEEIRALLPCFSSTARVRRLFIDEITAVAGWERALKNLIDAGELSEVLVVTTGSRAADLRRGSERLPGRKGRLARTSYLFTPISYGEFVRVCAPASSSDALILYQFSGGSPVALNELVTAGALPEYVIELVRDWILGEIARSGRHRSSLIAVMRQLLRHGGSPLGQARLAREAGLANNTVAAGYVEQLQDLLCVASAHAWEHSRGVILRRRPCKFHFINLLAATVWHPSRLRSVRDFRNLSPAEQGRWLEWLVAQELWRRAAIRGDEAPEVMAYWKTKKSELDFVTSPTEFLEVKRGVANPLEFAWFPSTFPGARLTVIGSERFDSERIRGITVEDFLLARVRD